MKAIKLLPQKNWFFIIALLPCFLFSKCKKDEVLPEYYIRCKIDGLNYLPNNCANCMRGQILRDTVFLMNANADYQTVGIGFYDGEKIGIKTYNLNGKTTGSAVYKNSTTTNDIFKTDSVRIGKLTVSVLDKTNKIIQGTFYFQAFNSLQNKTVTITEGKFRLKYTTN